LVHAVASALSIPEQRARPLSVTLVDGLRLKRLLLVLDNCEHLVESIARLADHLLRTCSDVHILATTGESLGVAGEVVWRVPPLAMPDPAGDVTPQDLVQTDAVRLFVERAQAVLPGFAETLNEHGIREVAKVCQQLDGIPLAIELAAARARVVAPEEIAERLQDRFSLLVGGSPLCRLVIRRSAPRWTGVTACCPRRSGGCSIVCRCSRAAGTSRRLRRCVRDPE
jgi:predicted ATPase